MKDAGYCIKEYLSKTSEEKLQSMLMLVYVQYQTCMATTYPYLDLCKLCIGLDQDLSASLLLICNSLPVNKDVWLTGDTSRGLSRTVKCRHTVTGCSTVRKGEYNMIDVEMVQESLEQVGLKAVQLCMVMV